MPVLSGDHEIESVHNPVYERDYRVAIFDLEGSTRTEVVLYIHDDENSSTAFHGITSRRSEIRSAA